jgi:hypothetical protein
MMHHHERLLQDNQFWKAQAATKPGLTPSSTLSSLCALGSACITRSRRVLPGQLADLDIREGPHRGTSVATSRD